MPRHFVNTGETELMGDKAMTNENNEKKRTEGEPAATRNWAAFCGPSGAGFEGCCGPDMKAMADGCDCGGFLKRHRLAAFTMFTVAALTFLIGIGGSILGIIAFFRTL